MGLVRKLVPWLEDWQLICLFFVYFIHQSTSRKTPSVLWRCWLGGRKGIRPVKKQLWGAAGMVICLEWGADLHLAQLMPLPLTVSCFSKIQICSTFLVPADLGSPWKRAVKRVCVCVSTSRKRNTVSQEQHNLKRIKQLCGLNGQHRAVPLTFCLKQCRILWLLA